MLKVAHTNAVVSALKPGRDGVAILRIYEASGKAYRHFEWEQAKPTSLKTPDALLEFVINILSSTFGRSEAPNGCPHGVPAVKTMSKRYTIAIHASILLLVSSGCARKDTEALVQSSGVIRLDPALDELVSTTSPIEKIAGGHEITEGPVYVPEGYLLFSDIPKNTIFKWTPGGDETVFRKPSGYDGTDAPAGAVIGSNGLTLDREGRLIICEHGNRRVTRFDRRDGSLTVLADRYEGKRLNSPNDVVVKSDGAIYFTDPPYGFAKQDDDPKKELKFNGLYRLSGSKLELLTSELSRPNGLAFSPDEKILYVANSDPARKIWMRYPVKADGTLGTGIVFQDVTSDNRDGLPDGMKVDKKGNLYCTSPGGVRIFSKQGKHIGSINLPEVPHNCAWGKYSSDLKSAALAPNEEADTLYITARPNVYRIRMKVAGVRPL